MYDLDKAIEKLTKASEGIRRLDEWYVDRGAPSVFVADYNIPVAVDYTEIENLSVGETRVLIQKRIQAMLSEESNQE